MAEMRRKCGKKLTPHFEHFDGGVFDYFCQKYWSQGHQNLLRLSHQYSLQIFFMFSPVTQKKFFFFSYML